MAEVFFFCHVNKTDKTVLEHDDLNKNKFIEARAIMSPSGS